MSFRLNRTDVFLTYPRTPKNFNPQMVLSKLSEKAEVKNYCISQEKHSEAKRRPFHIHAYIEFENKIDTKNVGYFDLEYYKVNYHPNIQKPVHRHAVLRYIKKDGNFIENFETRPAWLVILEDYNTSKVEFLQETMWKINRLDNYAGYRTFRDLRDEIEFLKRSPKQFLNQSEN